MFHISDIKLFRRCPKLFINNFQKKDYVYNPFLRNDEQLSDLVIEKLNIKDYFIGEKNQTNEVALNMLNQYDWLIKARFEYNNIRVKIPYLQKVANGYIIYFLQLQNYPKDDDLLYYYLNYYVLTNLGLNIVDLRLVHFNALYRRGDELDVHQLFTISDCFYNDSFKPKRNVFSAISNYNFDVDKVLKDMQYVLETHDYEIRKSKKCYKRSKCPLYYECFNNELLQADDSILTLVSSQYKNDMYNDGIKLLKDADFTRLEGNACQYAQIIASRNGGLYYDINQLRKWMKQLKGKTIGFLDFEWDTFAIPPFKSMKTFDVICFQYSLHKMDRDENIQHFEYLGYKDCRIEFIQSLIEDVNDCDVIVAFNANGGEKMRLKELMIQYPEYQDQLSNINNKMVDISLPFTSGMVYDVKMRGNYSLKVIANMIDPSIDYQAMDIGQGMDAVYNWRNMDRNNIIDEEVIKNLLSYCGQDTYAMVVIYEWLKAIVNKNS